MLPPRSVRALVLVLLLVAAAAQTTDTVRCSPGFSQDLYTVLMPHSVTPGQPVFTVRYEDCGEAPHLLFDCSQPDVFSVTGDGVVYVLVPSSSWTSPLLVTAWDITTRQQWQTRLTLLPAHEPSVLVSPLVKTLSRWSPVALKRWKRDWVIPPINVAENSRGPFPMKLVRIRSDMDDKVSLRYSVTGPGADQPPTGVFTIDPVSGLLSVLKPLDREHLPNFSLRAHAVDLNGNRVESPVDITINVIDMNDNRPEFTQQTWSGSVAEGSRPGTLVMTVTAEDQDDPRTLNGQLRYKILSQEPSVPSPHMFTINNRTGSIITVAAGLDRERVSQYTLIIQATDMEGNRLYGLSNTGTALIRVTDINDNPPEFSSSNFFGEVLENQQDVVVVNLTVTDKDQANTSAWRSRFQVISGDMARHFAVPTDSLTNAGQLTLLKPLDYETSRSVVLTVVVMNEDPLQSGLVPAPQSTATVSILVTDVNESPLFIPNPTILELQEGRQPESEICSFTAQDPDHHLEQSLRYSTLSDPADWLRIEPLTGRVSAVSVLDRESPFVHNDVYTALFLATDTGIPPASSTGTLQILLLDVNDNAPHILPLEAEMCEKPQNSGINITALDADLHPNTGPFSFQLATEPADIRTNWSISRLNDDYAQLALKIDYLESGRYEIPVIVSDSGDTPLSSTSYLQLKVCECDENGDCTDQEHIMAAGLSTGLIVTLLLCVIGLLILVLLFVLWVKMRNQERQAKQLLIDPEEDLRDSVLKYDEEGGGEEDQDYDLEHLQQPGVLTDATRITKIRRLDERPLHPEQRASIRPAPHSIDIADFIQQGLMETDADPVAPPYDSLLVFDYEGEGSSAGSLSSFSSCSNEGEQDFNFLQQWGPHFRKLADLYADADE